MAKEKQKRDKGNFLILQRSRFIVLALVAVIEIVLILGLSFNMLIDSLSGRIYWPLTDLIPYIVICIALLVLLLWASYRTYRHFWQDAVVINLRDLEKEAK